MTSNEKLKAARKRLTELKKRGTDSYIQNGNSLNNAGLNTAGQEEAALNAHRLAQALEEIALLKEQNRRFKEKIEMLESKVASYESLVSSESAEAPLPPPPRAEPVKPRVAIAETPTVIEPTPVDRTEELQKWNGWQVDLRGWKTLGVGPQIDI